MGGGHIYSSSKIISSRINLKFFNSFSGFALTFFIKSPVFYFSYLVLYMIFYGRVWITSFECIIGNMIRLLIIIHFFSIWMCYKVGKFTYSYLSHRVIVSFSRSLKGENIKIKTSILSPEGLKAQAKKTGFNFMIFILIFVENCLQYFFFNFLLPDEMLLYPGFQLIIL